MAAPEESRRTLFGSSFHLEATEPGLSDAVSRRLPPQEPAESRLPRRSDRSYRVLRLGSGGRWRVLRGPRRPVEVATLDEAAELVVSDMERHVARRSRGFVFVHAGAVVWKGRAILLPGRSLCGKSSLVASLLAAGAGYLSDEFAVIDAEGTVHPYARPLSLRTAGGLVDRVPAGALGGSVAGPAPAGLVAFLRFRRGARFEVAPVSPGESLLGLLTHTLEVRRRLGTAPDFLKPVATASLAIRGVRGEAAEAAHHLLSSAEASRPHVRISIVP